MMEEDFNFGAGVGDATPDLGADTGGAFGSGFDWNAPFNAVSEGWQAGQDAIGKAADPFTQADAKTAPTSFLQGSNLPGAMPAQAPVNWLQGSILPAQAAPAAPAQTPLASVQAAADYAAVPPAQPVQQQQAAPHPGRPDGTPSGLPELDFSHGMIARIAQGYGLSPSASTELAAISQKTGIGLADLQRMDGQQRLDHLVKGGASQSTIREIAGLAEKAGQPLPIPKNAGQKPGAATSPFGPIPAAAAAAPAQPAASRWAQTFPQGTVQRQFQDLGATPGEMQLIQIESSFKSGQKSGSNVGYGQFSPDLQQKYGITNPDDPKQVLAAIRTERAEFEKSMGRSLTDGEFYLMHQQGKAGGKALMNADPNSSAWQVIRPFYKSDAVAKSAIWGNVPDNVKARFGSVDNVTAGQFAGLWKGRFDAGGSPQAAAVASNVPSGSAPSSSQRQPPAGNAPQQPASVGDRMRAWVQQQVEAGKKAPQRKPDDSPITVQPLQMTEVEPVSSVVRSGGKVYYKRYGRVYDTSGNPVG